MKKCGECVNFHACELWNMGDMENANADHCTLYETIKDTAAYYLGLCDGKKDRWISIAEQLPEDYVNVLCWYEYFRHGDYDGLYQCCEIGHYISKFDEWFMVDGNGEHDRVIAWQPLPESYKEN